MLMSWTSRRTYGYMSFSVDNSHDWNTFVFGWIRVSFNQRKSTFIENCMAVQVIQHKTENQGYKAKSAHMAYVSSSMVIFNDPILNFLVGL